MAITQKSVKLLWAGAGGRCSFPDCWTKLNITDPEGSAPSTIGEMAHIRGERQGSNRHDSTQTSVERDDYQNLILLCPTHHTLIDKRENEARFPVELLHDMKARHEAKIASRLQPVQDHQLELESLIKEINCFLLENRQIWAQYGPTSPIAMKDPNNETVYGIWERERLSTIVPNNRKIADLLRANRRVFGVDDQEAISAFLIHAEYYEKWVNDEIPYAAIPRFPKQFEVMIRSATDARTQ